MRQPSLLQLMVIKLPHFLFLLLLLPLLSSSGSGLGLSVLGHMHLHDHHHHHHHHPIPRDLSIPIPILSIPLKQSPKDFRLFLRSFFWLFQNQKPKPGAVNEDDDATDRTSNANPLRKLLDHVQHPNSLNKASTSPTTFMPLTTTLSPNPAVPPTTPITVPSSSTNQVPAFPYQGPPVMVPVPVPPPPVLGQTWCVARPDMSESVLQGALDYACGFGGVDCTAIQFMGSCYNPNTVRAHASYAFNSYYQMNPVPSRCDFSAAAMLVNVNPSKNLNRLFFFWCFSFCLLLILVLTQQVNCCNCHQSPCCGGNCLSNYCCFELLNLIFLQISKQLRFMV